MARESTLEVAQSHLPEHNRLDPQKEHYAAWESYENSPQESKAVEDHGISRRNNTPWWLLIGVALATAVIVGGAVGGGLGSQLGKKSTYDLFLPLLDLIHLLICLLHLLAAANSGPELSP
jgi:hypothetical protein